MLPEEIRKPIESTRESERQNEPWAVVLQRIAHQHCDDGEEAKKRESAHAARIFFRVVAGSVSQAVRKTSRGERGQIFSR